MDPVNSLKQLGFTIEAIDGKESEFVFKVTGPAPTFFIKKTKRGKLLAYRSKEDKTDTTINGLYGFEVTGEGKHLDLVGKRTPAPKADKKEAA